MDSRWRSSVAPFLRMLHWPEPQQPPGQPRATSRRTTTSATTSSTDARRDDGLLLRHLRAPERRSHEARSRSSTRSAASSRCSPDHVVEIGTGWGGLAIHAAKHYGCRVTTTTISTEQHDYAREKIAREGLEDRITLLLEDYRDLRGTTTRRVDRDDRGRRREVPRHLPRQVLVAAEAGGAMLLQAITIQDQFYAQALQVGRLHPALHLPGQLHPVGHGIRIRWPRPPT
jgi:hypothetical protein